MLTQHALSMMPSQHFVTCCFLGLPAHHCHLTPPIIPDAFTPNHSVSTPKFCIVPCSNSALSQAPPPIPAAASYPDEDIYESLAQDELDPMAPPSFPSQAIPSLPLMNSAPRFPAPMEAPPPPPGTAGWVGVIVQK